MVYLLVFPFICAECWVQMARPLAVIAGHQRAVSYVRFLGASQLVTASTDNTLKLWDIQSASSSPALTKPLTTFSGTPNLQKALWNISLSLLFDRVVNRTNEDQADPLACVPALLGC